MDINQVKAYQAQKDHMMKNEGTHPANYSTDQKRAMDPSVSDAYLSDEDLKYRRDHMKDYIDRRFDYQEGQ